MRLFRGFAFGSMLQVLLVFNALMVLLPLVIMLFSAFKDTRSIFRDPLGLPQGFNFDNFRTVWVAGRFDLYFMNSLVVTAGSLLLIVLFGTMAGYALGRYSFFGNDLVYLFFLSGLMIPAKLMVIPLFLLLIRMGLINTHAGLILIYAASGLPAAVFIMTGFFRTLPSELDDAARIDGASEFGIFWRVMMPLVRPAMAIVTIYSAIPIWNDFFLPLVFIQSPRLKTLMQGLTVFFGQHQTNWGALFAGLTLAALPIVLLYLALSEQFIKGLTAGAVK